MIKVICKGKKYEDCYQKKIILVLKHVDLTDALTMHAEDPFETPTLEKRINSSYVKVNVEIKLN